jgi:hypothetical protein
MYRFKKIYIGIICILIGILSLITVYDQYQKYGFAILTFQDRSPIDYGKSEPNIFSFLVCLFGGFGGIGFGILQFVKNQNDEELDVD